MKTRIYCANCTMKSESAEKRAVKMRIRQKAVIYADSKNDLAICCKRMIVFMSK